MKYSLKVSSTDTGKEGLLFLGGDMTIMHAQEIKESLLEAIREVDTLYLDTGEVESVDISFIQLICASHREALFSEKKVSFQGSLGDSLKELFDRSGYFKQYGCPANSKETCMWHEMCV